jgi:hypothetical protein
MVKLPTSLNNGTQSLLGARCESQQGIAEQQEGIAGGSGDALQNRRLRTSE